MHWDQRYGSGDYPTDPHPLVVQAASMLSPCRALDLACGAGRNARYLRGLGWNVVAIDRTAARSSLNLPIQAALHSWKPINNLSRGFAQFFSP